MEPKFEAGEYLVYEKETYGYIVKLKENHTREIPNPTSSYISHKGYDNNFSGNTSFGISGNEKYMRYATKEEINWLDEAIKANKWIEKPEFVQVDGYFPVFL